MTDREYEMDGVEKTLIFNPDKIGNSFKFFLYNSIIPKFMIKNPSSDNKLLCTLICNMTYHATPQTTTEIILDFEQFNLYLQKN